jgi:cell division protein FtsW
MLQPSIYRLRPQDILLFCVLCLLFLGVLMVQSAAMNLATAVAWTWSERGTRHLIYVGIALLTFLIVGKLDYSHLARGGIWTSPVMWMLAIAITACVLVLVPGIGRDVNGARRWLPLGITQVQPSELAKWGVVIYLAWYLAGRRPEADSLVRFIGMLLPVGLLCLLVVMEDFGTAALIGLFALTMCLAGRVKLWHLLCVIPPALAAGAWFIMHKPYRLTRMMAFVDPFASPRAEGYHMVQSLLSFSTGGIFGTGLGLGVQKLGYLPEDTTDFIFAVICEELGLFGAMLTIGLYLGVLFVAWQAVRERDDTFGKLLAFGVGAMIGLQALINIAVATVSVPPKGLSLPLVSYGGTGLVITSAALGLLYSVCRRAEPAEAPQRRGFEVVMPQGSA